MNLRRGFAPSMPLKTIKIKINIAHDTHSYAQNPYISFDENPLNGFGSRKMSNISGLNPNQGFLDRSELGEILGILVNWCLIPMN